MPAVALSRVVASGPGGEDLATGTWQRLEALPDPRSRQAAPAAPTAPGCTCSAPPNTASIRPGTDIHGTRRSPAVRPRGEMPL
jgi:hypothetical protein